jgi:hypothetical protein
MSAANVHVRALDKSGERLTLRLMLIKPDVPDFCTTGACVVQMLWDKADAPPRRPAPILDAVSQAQRLDPAWLRRHQFDFVESVTLGKTDNYPAPVAPGGQPVPSLPQAVLEVTLTDSKWMAHVNKGSEWTSAPFDAAL